MVLKEKGQSTKQTCGQRAVFERNYREAHFKKVTYTVHGWRQQDGTIWAINSEVQIIDPIIGDQKALISKVIFTLDSSGMKTELTILKRDGYKREGADKPNQYGKSSADKGNKWKEVVE